jgi:DUF971 family protein
MTKKVLPILGQPNPEQPRDVHLVGRYALGVTWADGHSSIYPFDRLWLDDPAREGPGPDAVSDSVAWPREIKRLPEALRVVWADGRESRYPYPRLRMLCRCAGCTGGH